MKFSATVLILIVLLAGVLLAACAPADAPTPAPTVTLTPDACAPENMKAEAQKVHRLMREFDDASVLASNTARTEISPAIAGLQRIRRDAEDLVVPECLVQLKNYQLSHMNLVINTLLAFMGGAEEKVTSQGIALARQQHDAYMLELARVLGLTIVAPTQTAQAETPAAAGDTPAASAASATDTPAPPGLTVTVPGPNNVNLRKIPSFDGPSLGTMKVGALARVVGQIADGSWLLIEIPDQPGLTAWVYAPLVTVSGPLDDLPVVTPVP